MASIIGPEMAIKQVERWLEVSATILLEDPTKSIQQKIDALQATKVVVIRCLDALIARLECERN